jgi:hypothetical protein
LRAERALPSAVLGPRLAHPLARLAWRLASVIMVASRYKMRLFMFLICLNQRKPIGKQIVFLYGQMRGGYNFAGGL